MASVNIHRNGTFRFRTLSGFPRYGQFHLPRPPCRGCRPPRPNRPVRAESAAPTRARSTLMASAASSCPRVVQDSSVPQAPASSSSIARFPATPTRTARPSPPRTSADPTSAPAHSSLAPAAVDPQPRSERRFAGRTPASLGTAPSLPAGAARRSRRSRPTAERRGGTPWTRFDLTPWPGR